MNSRPPRPSALAFERTSKLAAVLRANRLSVGVALAAGVVGSLAANSPLLGLAAAVAAALAALALAQPALGAVAVAFLLWANVPVVAVRSHGVPMPIAASYILAISRAVGETMIVAIAAGSQPKLTANPTEGAATITAYIVQVAMGDLPHGSLEYQTIFAAGITLFFMTLAFNLMGAWLRKRYRQAY